MTAGNGTTVLRAVLQLEDRFSQVLDRFEQRAARAANGAVGKFDRLEREFADVAAEAARGGVSIERALDRVGRNGAARRQSRELQTLSKSFDRTDASARRVIGTLRNVAIAVGGVFTARGVLNELITFEQGLVGVGKTSNLSGSELQGLGDDVLNLAQRVPVAVSRLLELAESAGQLGVSGSGNILRFVETLARLESASNLAGTEGATALARILDLTGEDVSQVDRLGAAIVALGNNYKTAEREIAQTSTQIAQSTAAFNLSAADAAGLGTALAALGFRAELSGTAVGRAIRVIDGAARGGGDAMRELSRITGRTQAELADLVRTNPAQAFVELATGIKQATAAGDSAAEILQRLGLGGEELARVLPTLAQRADVLSSALTTAQTAAAANTALVEESAKAFDTLGARVTIAGNTLSAIVNRYRESTDGLSRFVDVGTAAIATIGGVADQSQIADERARLLAAGIEGMAAALTGFAAIAGVATVGRFALSIVAAANPVTTLAAGVGTLAGVMTFLSSNAGKATRAVEAQQRQVEQYQRTLRGLRDVAESVRQAAGEGDVRARVQVAQADLRAADQAFDIIKKQIAEARAAGEDPIDIRVDLTQVEEAFRGTSFAKQIDLASVIEFRGDRLKQSAVSTIESTLNGAINSVNLSENVEDVLLGSSFSSDRITKFIQDFEGARKRISSGGTNLNPTPIFGPDVERRATLIRELIADISKEANAVSAEFAQDLLSGLVRDLRGAKSEAEKLAAANLGVGTSGRQAAGDISGLEGVIRALTGAQSALAGASQQARSELAGELTGLRDRVDGLRLQAAAGTEVAEVTRLATLAQRAGISVTEEAARSVLGLVEAESALEQKLSATTALSQSLESLNERVDLLRLEAAFGADVARVAGLVNLARQAGIPITREATSAAAGLVSAESELEARLSATAALDGSLRALDERVRLLRTTAEQGRIAADVERLITAARAAGIEPTEKQVEAVKRLIEERERLGELVAQQDEQQRGAEEAFDTIGRGFARTAIRFVNDIATGSEEALQNLGKGVVATIQSALEKAIEDTLADLFSSGIKSAAGALAGAIGLARGGVVDGGRVSAFASGAVLGGGVESAFRSVERFGRGGVPRTSLAKLVPGGVAERPVGFVQADGTPSVLGEAGREGIFPEFGRGGRFTIGGRLPDGSEIPVEAARISGGRLGVDLRGVAEALASGNLGTDGATSAFRAGGMFAGGVEAAASGYLGADRLTDAFQSLRRTISEEVAATASVLDAATLGRLSSGPGGGLGSGGELSLAGGTPSISVPVTFAPVVNVTANSDAEGQAAAGPIRAALEAMLPELSAKLKAEVLAAVMDQSPEVVLSGIGNHSQVREAIVGISRGGG